MRTRCLHAALAAIALTAGLAPAQWSSTALSEPRAGLGATNVGDRALFAGGLTGSSWGGFSLSDVVDVHDASLGHPTDPATWTTASLSEPRMDVAAVTVGGFALFAGGSAASGDSDVVDVYVAATGAWDLTHLSQVSGWLSPATVGSLALFADGSVVEVYDAALGPPTDPGAWRVDPVAVTGLAATVGDHALFVGDDVLHVYDDSTGAWSTHSFDTPGWPGAAVALGSRALFAFHVYEPPQSFEDRLVVAIYDASVGEPPDPAAWSWVEVGLDRWPTCAAVVGARAVIASAGACGSCSDGVPAGTTDIYLGSTGGWLADPYFTGLSGQAATTVDGKAMFAGGMVFLPQGMGFFSVSGVGVCEQNNYCSANANSSGLAARMTVAGTASLEDDALTLRAEPVPDQSYLFFFGPSQQELPFGNGFLCAGGGLTRVGPPQAAAGGVAQRALDLPSLGITAPGTLHFQCWFRDPAAGGALFNTSDGTSVTFVP